MKEGDTHPMERLAIFASIALAAVMLRTWVIVERADDAIEQGHFDRHKHTELVIYRAEWTDRYGILRSVETRGMVDEPITAIIERHHAELNELAKSFPPR